MPELGFHRYAMQSPNHLAIAAPDGRHWTRGELWAECERRGQQTTHFQQGSRESDQPGLAIIIARLSAGSLAADKDRSGLAIVNEYYLNRIASFDVKPLDAVHFCTTPGPDSENLDWAVALLHSGYSLVITDRWDAEQMLRTIARYRAATLFIDQQQARKLLSLSERRASTYDISSLRHLILEKRDKAQELYADLETWLALHRQ